MRTISLVVLYGFETKNFFASGLHEKVSQYSKSKIIKRRFQSENFREYILNYKLDVIEIDEYKHRNRTKVEELFSASRRAKQRINNVVNFNYFKSDRDVKYFDYIIGSDLLFNILEKYMMSKLAVYYYDNKIEKIYKNENITDIIISGYGSVESMILTNTIKKNGGKVWLIINSWKDFFVNDFIPFSPTKIFVWSEEMKKQILTSNNHISDLDIIVSGNPSFDRFFNYQPVNKKQYYADKYNFDIERPLILYSMISPKAYAFEKESIELINQKLTTLYLDEKNRPIILLRRNPIDETEVNETYFSNSNVRYAENYFEASYENSVFVQLEEGEVEWMDLLYYADININIASTVTLESLMMKKPVINIEFDKSGKENKDLLRYAQAPFYKPLHDRKDVVIASNIDICVQAIDDFLTKEIIISDFTEILSYFDGKATDRIVNEINNV